MVSIIIPVFNREKFLTETIDSVIKQTYPNWELLLVDDGSTDRSIQIAQEFANKDARIKSIQRDRTPKGAPTCRNIGMDVAKGDYLMFLDSDDFMKSDCLNRRVAFMDEHGTFDFSVWHVAKKFADGKTELWSDLSLDNDLLAFLRAKGWQTSSSFFRADFVRQFSWDEQACSWQDWEFHIRILLKSSNYVKHSALSEDVFIDRSGGEKITNSNQKPERVLCLLQLFERLKIPMTEQGKAHLHPVLFTSYFRFVESAAVKFCREDFKNIISFFKETSLFKKLRYKRIISFYLQLLSSLKMGDKHWFQAPLYRARKLFFPLS